MKSPAQRRSGFTLVEVTIASALTAFLAVLLSTTWWLLMPAMENLIAWGQLFQEMDIAVAALARDSGGSQLDFRDSSVWLGEKTQGRLLACRKSNDFDGDHLQFCFDGGNSPNNTADWSESGDDAVIDYYVDSASHTLMRWNKKLDPVKPFTVANHIGGKKANGEDVVGMTVEDNTDNLTIKLTFLYVLKANINVDKTNSTAERRNLIRQCTLIIKKSP
jgi:prepilin-type N-terminal cleavage/methylation domain-containing protein